MKKPRSIHTLLVGISLALSGALAPAMLVVHDTPTRPTPENLAYNLGHFFPGSNTADWWRYARVSGARIFMTPSHFNVSGTLRPGEENVVDQASFLARRAALRADPLNTDYINWPVIGTRFNTALSGNNRIVPQYALEEIHKRGGRILAQMTLSEGAFPIADEDDWARKWIAWRTYYSLAFHLAREFDVERYSSHNEPNHSASFIEPAQWLMRLRLSSDAVDCAIADVNALYGKSLQARFNAPVSASAFGSGYENYGRPAVESIRTDFLGQTSPGYQVFHQYAYQQYNQSPNDFANNFLTLRQAVDFFSPSGLDPLAFGITEFNVHTGATYDTLVENADSLSKTVRLGAILTRLVAAGMDELYLFKFGMTVYSNRFPVQKNGMLYSDNRNVPYSYGTMSRGAEAYRLFNKAFAPGRELLGHTASGLAADLFILAGRDPVSGFHYIYSVNETGSSIPLEIDLSALGIPEGQHVVIEDVSQWRSGVIRSLERVSGGRIQPGAQPGQTVWLVTIPREPQRVTGGDQGLFTLPVIKDAMVRDGAHADANFGAEPAAWARNDPADVDQRAAAFLQFDLPENWNPADLQLAVLEIPVASINGGGTVHAHLYGIDNHDWEEDTLAWNNAPNLRKGAPAGNQIRHGAVEGAGDSAHILGQLTAGGSYTLRRVDVTDYLVRQHRAKASFLITQDPRWDVDINVTRVPESWDELASGDTQPDGLRVWTREGATQAQPAASLVLIRREPQPLAYDTWIAAAFPGETDPAVIGRHANPAGDRLPNLLKFALGLDPAAPAGADAPRLILENASTAAVYFTRNQMAADVSLQVRATANLNDWSPIGPFTTLEDDGTRARLKATVPLPPDGAPLFLRFVAEPQR